MKSSTTLFGSVSLHFFCLPAALLYIVPSMLGSVILRGASRAELRKLWSFTDVKSYGLGTFDLDGGNEQGSKEKKQ